MTPLRIHVYRLKVKALMKSVQPIYILKAYNFVKENIYLLICRFCVRKYIYCTCHLIIFCGPNISHHVLGCRCRFKKLMFRWCGYNISPIQNMLPSKAADDLGQAEDWKPNPSKRIFSKGYISMVIY